MHISLFGNFTQASVSIMLISNMQRASPMCDTRKRGFNRFSYTAVTSAEAVVSYYVRITPNSVALLQREMVST